MEIRVCPQCNKAFYASPDAECLVCSHCGHVIYDRRRKERVEKELDFNIPFKGRPLPAKLMDYSEGGLKAVYKGGLLKVDTVFDLDIGELDIHAEVKTVWTKKVSKSVYASGFKFLN
jgi:hypothetical protein